MAVIRQQLFFSWEQFEGTDDLERLKMVLLGLPDEELMLKLEVERKGRRDDVDFQLYSTTQFQVYSTTFS